MSEVWFELHFEGGINVELVETRFKASDASTSAVAVRGKTAGVFGRAGTFQWTSAVRGLAILCVRTVIAHQLSSKNDSGGISGYRGSLAASLDYAISKQPTWLVEMYGAGSKGIQYSRQLFVRSNPERKRPGPVVVGLNERLLPPTSIHVILNGQPLITQQQLQSLLPKIPKAHDTGFEHIATQPLRAVAV